MGKGSSGSSTTTSVQQANPQAVSEANSAYTAAQSAASQPYQYYSGQLVAPLNANQNQAISTVANANGIANPYINAASSLTSAATQPIGASQINQFMNPYISDTVNTTAQEINQNNAIQQNQLQGNAAAQGALGGDRVGLAQAALANQQDMAENQTLAGLYSSGYNTALSGAQTQNAQDLQGAYEYGNLGSTAQNTALAGANAQLQTGAVQQQQQQNVLNQAYGQWEGAQQYPFQTGEYLTNAAGSLGGLYGGSSSTTTPAPSVGSQVVGGLESVAGLVGAFGLLKRGGRTGYADGGRAEPGHATLGELIHYMKLGHAVHRAMGGRTGYDDGGDIPYQTGPVEGQDQLGNTRHYGYIPQQGSWVVGRYGGPAPPAGVSAEGSAGGTPVLSNATADNLAAGADAIKGWWTGESNGIGDSMGGASSDADVVAHQGAASGGRIGLASGGTTPGTGTSLGGLSAQSGSILGSAPTQGQEIENYQFLSPLISSGHAPQEGQQQPTESPLQEEQQEGQEIAATSGRARGGRAGYDAGGGLPAFQPAGGAGAVTGSAPQPTSTANTNPATWGGVAMPQAPQLAAPQGAAPGTSSLPALGGATAQNFMSSYTGSQDPYTAYIESLPGSNPSGGNPAPSVLAAEQAAAAVPAAVPAAAVSKESFLQNLVEQSGYTHTGKARGGRAGYDAGGSADPLTAGYNAGAVQDGAPPLQPGLAPLGAAKPVAAFSATPTSPAQPTAGLGAAKPTDAGYYQKFAAINDQVESGGNPNAQSSTSTAGGLGQFTDGTWLGVERQYDPATNGMSDSQVLARKTIPAVAQDMTAQYAQQNATALQNAGYEPSYLNLRLADYFGAEGAKAILSAPPATPIEKVVSKQDIQSNPTLAGKTVAQVVLGEQEKLDAASGNSQVAQNGASDAGDGGVPPQQNGAGFIPGIIGDNSGLGGLQDSVNAAQYGLTPPQPTEVDKIANSPWTALAAAGLATMGGTSPFASVNIGRGGLAGLQYLQGTEGQERANNQNAANISATGQELQQTGNKQDIDVNSQVQNEQQIKSSFYTAMLNAYPAMTQSQLDAAWYNYAAGQTGNPQITPPSVPGSPPGAPSLAPSDGASGNVIPMPVASAPSAPVATPQFAQSATGIAPVGAASVDTTVMGPNGQQMPFQRAYQMAQQMQLAGGSPGGGGVAQRGTAWLANAQSQLNPDGVRGLVDASNAAAAQTQTLDDMADEAAQTHVGPATGKLLSSLVQSYEDISTLFGGQPDPSITSASIADQVIPKLTTTMLSQMGRLASDPGGSEALKMMLPSVPTIDNTGTGIPKLVQVYNTVNQRASALGAYVSQATSTGIMSYNQAVAAFNQQYPPQMWASRVNPLPSPYVPGMTTARLKPGFSYASPDGSKSFVWTGSGWQ